MDRQTARTSDLPMTETETRRLAAPLEDPHTDAARTAAIQAHLHEIVHELHHGKGSHDDPDLPDGPTIDLTDEETAGAAAPFDASFAAAPRPETSMQGGL
jgi:hypothetical protein